MGRWVSALRAERGAAAVEAGLVSTFLMPLMIGVLVWGNHFWHEQKVQANPPRIAQGTVTGYGLTCQQLVDLVKQAVVDQANTLGDAYAQQIGLGDVTADVVEVLPTVGAVVHVSVRVPDTSGLTATLPDAGAVVSDATLRLDDVTLTTSTCA